MGRDADGEDAPDPTSLRYVGPATAAVVDRAPFDAAAIRDGRVSVRALLEAGVNPGVAERLRREYGLPWAHRWHGDGQHLARRAAAIRGAGDDERRWIAAAEGGAADLPGGPDGESATATVPAEAPDDVDLESLDWPDWPAPEGGDPASGAVGSEARAVAPDADCPRCGGCLSRFTLGDRASVLCDDCGYAGVPVDHGGEDAWRTAVDRLLRGGEPPRRE